MFFSCPKILISPSSEARMLLRAEDRITWWKLYCGGVCANQTPLLLTLNVLRGEPLFTCLDPNIYVKCETAFSEFCECWCFSMSKLESSILDTIMRRVGPLPSCRAAHSHGNIYCLRRNYPMSKKSATQLRSAVWTTVFALLQKWFQPSINVWWMCR